MAVHACLDSGLSVEETLTGMTLNAAASLGLAAEIGSLEPGKSADLVILDAPDDRHLIYHWGVNLVAAVVSRGRVAWTQPAMTDFSKLTLDEFLAALASDAPTPGGGTAAAIGRRDGRVAGRDGRGADALEGEVRRLARRHAPDRRGGAAGARGVRRASPARTPRPTTTSSRRGGCRRRPTSRRRRGRTGSRSPTGAPPRCRCETARAAVRLLARPAGARREGQSRTPPPTSGAAALLLDACVEGALLNVGINLSGIEDAGFVAEMQRETAVLQEESQRLRSQVVALVRKRF